MHVHIADVARYLEEEAFDFEVYLFQQWIRQFCAQWQQAVDDTGQEALFSMEFRRQLAESILDENILDPRPYF